MRPWVSKYLLYLPTQALRREPVLAHLRDLDASQWWSTDQLRERQLARLRDTVAHAEAHVPHYRAAFSAAGFSASSLRSLEDFAAVPVLEKDVARRVGEQLVSERARGRIDRRQTSGSTGLPMPIRKPRDAIARIRAIWYRYARWYGVGIGDRQGRFLGHPVTWQGVLKEDVQDFILNKDRLDPVYLTPERMGRYWERVQRRPLDYLYGYPSAMVAFARFLANQGFDASKTGVRALLCTGETLHDAQARFLEESYGAPAVNEWGCTESGVLGFPCPEERRMHLSADNVLIEVLVGDRPAAPGEAGDIVVTDLHSVEAPLIRYRLGDVAVQDDGSPCSCGRGLPTIAAIRGRTSEVFTLPNGREVHSEAFAYISDAISAADDSVEGFLVRQTSENRFVLQLATAVEISEGTRVRLDGIVARVFGEGVEVTVEGVRALPRSPSGKLRYFVPLREAASHSEGSA